MSTVTAAKGLAANPQVNSRVFVGSIADGFQKVRPKSFAASLLGEGQLETGLLAFTAMLNCGSVSAGAHPHRETLRVIAIQGASDAYPLQWAKPLLPCGQIAESPPGTVAWPIEKPFTHPGL